MKIGIAYYVLLKFFPFLKLMKKCLYPRETISDELFNPMNQFNNLIDNEEENELNLPNCKYRDQGYFKNLTKYFKRKALSFFHMNIISLTKNFDDCNILLSE